MLYGLPGEIRQTGDHSVRLTQVPQGAVERFCVLTGGRDALITTASVPTPTSRHQPDGQRSPTIVNAIGRAGRATIFELTFRREPAPTELRQWLVRPGNLERGVAGEWQNSLPDDATTIRACFPAVAGPNDPAQVAALPNALTNFQGAEIDNAFSELQETWIDLRASPASAVGAAGPNPNTLAAEASLPPGPALAKAPGTDWWFQTRFTLPFMFTDRRRTSLRRAHDPGAAHGGPGPGEDTQALDKRPPP